MSAPPRAQDFVKVISLLMCKPEIKSFRHCFQFLNTEGSERFDHEKVCPDQRPYAPSHAEITPQPANPPKTEDRKMHPNRSLARASLLSRVAEQQQDERQADAIKNREIADKMLVKIGEDQVPLSQMDSYFKQHPEQDEKEKQGLLEMTMAPEKAMEDQKLEIPDKYAALFDENTSKEEWTKMIDELVSDPNWPFDGTRGC